ncbi:MAG TPA: malto-oligosyltrehalose trehalohydrolase, partial [Myxococcaceae bacterium]|nr:malto-oligosyltrehalose trehalohydrolase [Myxococcaceae bacterium]
RGPSGSALHLLVNVRSTLEYPLPEGAALVLWSEAPRFGGSMSEPPLRDRVLRLDGPSAALVRLAGRTT